MSSSSFLIPDLSWRDETVWSNLPLLPGLHGVAESQPAVGVKRGWFLQRTDLGSNPDSDTYKLQDLGGATEPLRPSAPSLSSGGWVAAPSHFTDWAVVGRVGACKEPHPWKDAIGNSAHQWFSVSCYGRVRLFHPRLVTG